MPLAHRVQQLARDAASVVQNDRDTSILLCLPAHGTDAHADALLMLIREATMPPRPQSRSLGGSTPTVAAPVAADALVPPDLSLPAELKSLEVVVLSSPSSLLKFFKGCGRRSLRMGIGAVPGTRCHLANKPPSPRSSRHHPFSNQLRRLAGHGTARAVNRTRCCRYPGGKGGQRGAVSSPNHFDCSNPSARR